MIRTLTVSAILGALVVGGALSIVRSPLLQTAIELRSDSLEQFADAEAAIENWPICTTTVDAAGRTALIKALAEEARNVEYAKLHPKFAQTFGLGHAPSAE